MMITIKCRIIYTTIIDIILLSIKKKPTEHSMHVMQSSQKKISTVFWQIKEPSNKINPQNDAF